VNLPKRSRDRNGAVKYRLTNWRRAEIHVSSCVRPGQFELDRSLTVAAPLESPGQFELERSLTVAAPLERPEQFELDRSLTVAAPLGEAWGNLSSTAPLRSVGQDKPG